MRKFILLLIALLALTTGCASKVLENAAKDLVANDYVDILKTAELPIDNIIIYTAETDANKLLGRPNQYISKTSFADTTIEQLDKTNPTGGSVEVFKNSQDAKKRKEYIDEIGKSTPLFVEYSYLNDKALLRLDKSLTPEQAKKV